MHSQALGFLHLPTDEIMHMPIFYLSDLIDAFRITKGYAEEEKEEYIPNLR